MSHSADHADKRTIEIHSAGEADARGHHSHVIVSQRVLLAVLGLLLFFTLATVGAAQAEAWIAHTYNVVIPQWVNVFVALSIAAVKTIIVAAYFMQLRYDNPMNTCIAVFTVFVLAFFFGFTMIDLGTRHAIYEWKGREVVLGGSATVPENSRVNAAKKVEQLVKDGVTPPEFLCHFASEEIDRLKAKKAEIPEYLHAAVAMGEKKYGAHGHHGHDHGDAHAPSENTPNRSRAFTGLTIKELMDTPADGKHDGKDHKHAPAGGH
ncbi:MAG: cytochrome C oxidase subunit IV family protein [Phycisphaerales bacterium]